MDAINEFKFYATRKDPECILEHYRWLVSRLVERRRKLKNPFHHRTGKPLKAITIKYYRSNLLHYQQSVQEMKEAIRMMIICDILGNGKSKLKLHPKVTHSFLKRILEQVKEKEGLDLYNAIFMASNSEAIIKAQGRQSAKRKKKDLGHSKIISLKEFLKKRASKE